MSISKPRMNLFGLSHCLTLLTIGLFGGLLLMLSRGGKTWPLAVLAWLNLSTYAVNQASYRFLDFPLSLENILPFHLCDVAAVMCALALLTRKNAFCELAYLWGLAGTLQGLLTPNMPYPPSHPAYWSFFLQHGVVVISALSIPLALKWRPTRGTFWRAQFWSQVYFFSALGINFLLGTNYGFLREKPQEASLLDHFGDWPYYLIFIQCFGVVAFLLLLSPFRRSRKRSK